MLLKTENFDTITFERPGEIDLKKKVIAYVHTHWDREWYREYEIFRMRLLRVFDNVLDMLKKGTLPSFYFDGQTSALCDYLEIRPEREDEVRKFVKEKKLFIGPFYCLADEFLTDEKCFRKNLEIGLKTAKDFGCEDFVGYFADTFGHSASTIPILKEYGINTAIVWRGVGDIPAEFVWKFNGSEVNTINLVRGYFHDVFLTPWDINKKAEYLKSNLDKISDKSGEVLLLPIGADHLGVENNLSEQINEINSHLNDYEIKLGTIFDYVELVKDRFSQYSIEGELLDNSKTFVLEGCYSSRLDIKKLNTISSYKLDLADRLQNKFGSEYTNLIEYAYKLLLQNQAHDSICGCSTDNVHSENITRYKKIQQIADNIIEEIRFKNGYNLNKIINLSDKPFDGTVEFKSEKELPYQVIKKEKGFPAALLSDTQRIPITEDYTDIYTYLTYVQNLSSETDLKPDEKETDVFITDNCIGNSNIFLIVENGEIRIGNKRIKFIDYKDEGDSYNTGYVKDDKCAEGKVLSSKIIAEGSVRSVLGIDVDVNGDVLHVTASLDKESTFMHFNINWENTKKNHLLEFCIDTLMPVEKTCSEDFENIIERSFDPYYNVRENLPKEKGVEVKTNTAPMRRGVCSNGVGIITVGLTQYEVVKTELRIPILRATGQISNPKNPARTTPAGPPIETSDLQQLGQNEVDFYVFFGDDLKDKIETVYNKCVIL